ncbi:MAG: hypothetical protein D6713_04235 [Deltaproteobacteria bacterium]|nr:MAG: hypothetical protein D6713_04235 [Deltaproteobacteria bacterium]
MFRGKVESFSRIRRGVKSNGKAVGSHLTMERDRKKGRGKGERTSILIFTLLLLLIAAATASGREAERVTDARGKAFSPGPYRRIVSLAPNLTEILFSIGAGDRVVGVTSFCTIPPDAGRIARVGGIVDPDIEKIIALSPDLVVASKNGTGKSAVETLDSLGLSCFVFDVDSAGKVLEAMETLSLLTGMPPEAGKVIESFRSRLLRLRKSTPREKVKGLLLLSVTPPIGAGGKTFIDEVLALAGVDNLLKEETAAYPRLSAEKVVSLRPDYIFITRGMGEREVARFRKTMEALSGNTRIVEVDADLFTRPGPRVLKAVEVLRKVIGRR